MSVIDTEDIPTSPASQPHFNEIVEAARSRRGFLKAGLAVGAVSFLGAGLTACGGGSDDDDDTPPAPVMLGFTAVAANSLDTITVPTGYRSAVFCRWGDPLFSDSPAWQPDATNTAESQRRQFGDNHDGMHFFPINGSSTEGLLVMNHEYLNDEFFYPAGVEPGGTGWTLEQVRKGQYAHGVSVAHVRRVNGNWEVVIPSQYNRRIHGLSAIAISGPAKGHPLMRTSADPAGEVALGTLNNCGNGTTLWGTYLTCEENFNGYFSNLGGVTRNANEVRYGLPSGNSPYRWADHDPRFDYSNERNEPNRFGWMVEIDPFRPNELPKKRTALGRFKHENSAMTLAANNRVVVYMGDDQANDYVYKFVSDGTYNAATPELNRDLLDAGTLYVARFDAGATANDMMGSGVWIPLVRSTPTTTAGQTLGDLFADMGELLVNTRLAADAVGATRMDRPEWVTVHPSNGEVYITMTNNSGRTVTDEANPRASNVYGQILRWREAGNDAAATTFEWDIFVLAGNPTVHTTAGDLRAGTSNVTADNLFNSPDGLAFDADGRLWIQTDGNFSNLGNFAGMGNNQMLVADPQTREIRRFLVGPSGCEITGITWTPDQRTMFINVQHPGEYGSHPNRPTVDPKDDALAFSQWPEAAGGRPRSATVVVWKEDGGVIGT
jgi:secreted PhoX family phosphatase